jgi:hypothetical protein
MCSVFRCVSEGSRQDRPSGSGANLGLMVTSLMVGRPLQQGASTDPKVSAFGFFSPKRRMRGHPADDR